MVGAFAHWHVQMHWTLKGGNHQWLFAVTFGDVGISRRFPETLTQVEAEDEATRVAPELFRVAERWLTETAKRPQTSAAPMETHKTASTIMMPANSKT